MSSDSVRASRRRTHRLFDVTLLVDSDLHRADRLSTLLDRASNFRHVSVRRRCRFRKDVDVVARHPFLCDEDLFGAVDDEVTASVELAFVVLGGLLDLIEQTEVGE